MGLFIAIVIGAVLAVGMQWLVIRVCQRCPVLKRWQVLLAAIAVLWCGTVASKKLYLDRYYRSLDSTLHEEVARNIAYDLSRGRFAAALDHFGAGNQGYDFLYGVFYAITGVPEIITYAINAVLAFWGTLALLEVLCRKSRCTSVPLWLVLIVCASPTALFWTTANLKEGIVLWGICMMLRFTLRSESTGPREGLWLPLLGLAAVGFLRPHYAIAYLVAIGVGMAIRQGKMGVGLITAVGVAGAFFILQQLRPEILEQAAERGYANVLDQRYAQLNDSGGSAITYRRGRPVPVVSGMILLWLRPLPMEVSDVRGLLAGMEVWFITGMALVGWLRLRRRMGVLMSAFTITALVTLLLMSFYFSYMYNMGLMVRQRLMVFPAMLAFAAAPHLALAARRRIPQEPQLRRPSSQFRHSRERPTPSRTADVR